MVSVVIKLQMNSIIFNDILQSKQIHLQNAIKLSSKCTQTSKFHKKFPESLKKSKLSGNFRFKL